MIVTILNDTRYENHHGCSRVMNCIDRNLFLNKITSINYIPLLENWSLNEDIKRKIIQSNFIIINGEGTLHGDKSHVNQLLRVILFAKNYNIRVGIINATIFNIDEEALSLVRESSFVYVRDHSSLNYLKTNLINAKYCPDLVFWNARNILNINYSRGRLLGYSDGMCFNPSNTKNFLSEFHPISIFNKNQAYNSYRLRRKILTKFKNLLSSSTKPKMVDNHVDFMKHLLNYEFIITGRYHLVCYCLALGIPFKFIESNTPKISYLLSDICLNIEKFRYNNDVLYFNYSDDEKNNISIFLNNADFLITSMFKNICTEND